MVIARNEVTKQSDIIIKFEGSDCFVTDQIVKKAMSFPNAFIGNPEL